MILSICIPTYNRLSILIRLLDKLVKDIGSYVGDIEIIVSENYSTEVNKIALLNHNLKNYKSYTLFQQKTNLGAIENIYYLLSKAKGEYVYFFSDDDDYVDIAFVKIIDILKSYKPNCLYVNYVSFLDSIENLISSPDIDPYSGLYNEGLEVFSNLTKKNGEIFMFISSMIYCRSMLNGYVRKLQHVSLIDPIKFSIACCQNNFFVEPTPLIYQRMSNASWSSDGTSIFSWKVPNGIMDCEDILGRNNVKSIIESLYKRNRNFVHIINAPIYFKYKLIILLRWKIIYLFYDSIFYILTKSNTKSLRRRNKII